MVGNLKFIFDRLEKQDSAITIKIIETIYTAVVFFHFYFLLSRKSIKKLKMDKLDNGRSKGRHAI